MLLVRELAAAAPAAVPEFLPTVAELAGLHGFAHSCHLQARACNLSDAWRPCIRTLAHEHAQVSMYLGGVSRETVALHSRPAYGCVSSPGVTRQRDRIRLAAVTSWDLSSNRCSPCQ